MPIKIPDGLPARELLEKENIYVIGEGRAVHQDIRPLKIAVMNLMPTKITTETQLIRLLSNTPLQIELTLLCTASHTPKHTPPEHMKLFYRSLPEIMGEYFDGLIMTGAPVEELPFEQVDYWPELCSMMEWSKTHVYSCLHICWAAQAALFFHHGVQKHLLSEKLSGIYLHRTLHPAAPMLRGFDECFMAPHSRHTGIDARAVTECPALTILADSEDAGPYLIGEGDRRFYITGHPEYDSDTLSGEYFRDKAKGLDTHIPANYFPGDDPTATPMNLWRSHAHLMFSNWLNNVVYQGTPYDLSELPGMKFGTEE